MNIFAALLFGVVAGMRTLTGEAVYFGLRGGPLAIVFPIAAVLEYAGDLYPKTPSRTWPPAVAGRIVSGAAMGWIVGGVSGMVLAIIGSLIGAYGGLQLRFALMRGIRAVPAALLEDAIAIALAFCAYNLSR